MVAFVPKVFWAMEELAFPVTPNRNPKSHSKDILPKKQSEATIVVAPNRQWLLALDFRRVPVSVSFSFSFFSWVPFHFLSNLLCF